MITIDPTSPFWVNSLAEDLSIGFVSSLKSASDINLTDNSNIELDPDELLTTNDEYDYISLTIGARKDTLWRLRSSFIFIHL